MISTGAAPTVPVSSLSNGFPRRDMSTSDDRFPVALCASGATGLRTRQGKTSILIVIILLAAIDLCLGGQSVPAVLDLIGGSVAIALWAERQMNNPTEELER